VKIDLTLKAGPVTVTGDALTIDLDVEKLVDGPADAMALVVKDAIRSQPGSKWHRTGRLLGGIRADGGNVTGPSGRLEGDDLAERFDDEVMPTVITADRRVAAAIVKSVDDMFKEGRRGR
jgi:hypothetical protein